MSRLNAEHEEITGKRWARVQLSRQVLSYSNQNIRLTTQIFLLSNKQDIESMLVQRAKNVEKI